MRVLRASGPGKEMIMVQRISDRKGNTVVLQGTPPVCQIAKLATEDSFVLKLYYGVAVVTIYSRDESTLNNISKGIAGNVTVDAVEVTSLGEDVGRYIYTSRTVKEVA
jgi:hypothetical protein